MSAGKDSPPPSNAGTPQPSASLSGDRPRRRNAGKPWRTSERRAAGFRQAVRPVSGSTVRRVPRPACQRFGSSGKPRRHHRRKRGVNARRCVRPCRTGSRPSRRAVRLQGRLTPFESVRQFRPMSAGKDSPPDSGKPRRVPRPACQRFGSRHHRKRRPCAGSERRHHRTRASRPALDRKRRPFDRAGSVRACQRFGSSGKPRRRIPQPFDRWPEASASPAPVASRPRRIRHHRRKRATNARRCVRPRRTGSRPSRRAVRLQGRLTPPERGQGFPPMSANAGSVRAAGTPRNRSRLSAVRKFRQAVATVCRPLPMIPATSNAATIGKPSGLSAIPAGKPSRRSTVCRRPLPMIPATVPRPVSGQPSAPRPASDDSGNRSTVATVRACQRFGSRHHRTRASRGDRVPPDSGQCRRILPAVCATVGRPPCYRGNRSRLARLISPETRRNRPPLRPPAPDGFAPVTPCRALARPFNAA